MIKPKEFTLRLLINTRTTIKTANGSFEGSGGEIEASFTFPEGTDVDEAIQFTKDKTEKLRNPDTADWLTPTKKEQEASNKRNEEIQLTIKTLEKQNKK